MNNMMLLILLILPIGLIIFFIIKKKKQQSAPKKQRKEDRDEVWATVKKHLREENELGKEVIDIFTVKRPNPYDVSTMTKEQKVQFKLKQKETEKLKTTNPEEYKKIKMREAVERKRKPRDLYVVLFTTRDTKTMVVDEPRAIECEVILKKIDKTRTERIIEVTGKLDYDKENEWIKPIRDREDKIYKKQLEREEKRQLRIQKNVESKHKNFGKKLEEEVQ